MTYQELKKNRRLYDVMEAAKKAAPDNKFVQSSYTDVHNQYQKLCDKIVARSPKEKGKRWALVWSRSWEMVRAVPIGHEPFLFKELLDYSGETYFFTKDNARINYFIHSKEAYEDFLKDFQPEIKNISKGVLKNCNYVKGLGPVPLRPLFKTDVPKSQEIQYNVYNNGQSLC